MPIASLWQVSTFAMGLITLAGCAHAPAPSAIRGGEVRLPVPFFPQTSDQCGPSSLASVLAYWGHPVEPRVLRSEIYQAKLHGTLPMDLMFGAQSHGLVADMHNGSLDELHREIDAKRPVIVYLNLGYTFMPIGHFVVVTGYNERGVFAHSASHADQFFAVQAFEKKWSKTDHWLLVAHPETVATHAS
jgi:ABC-type bacteriocin/lantibiotic exporter with double-glycine peptidase domain